MTKTLIYSCVFFNETYIHLLSLLLRSYKLFGNPSDNVDYLVICNTDFRERIEATFDSLDISGDVWCLDLKTMFEAGFSRLRIFDYQNINIYNKLLYLDCDILVTNSVKSILDFPLENKLHALEEGNTNHGYWGSQFFDKNPNCPAFTSGALLFSNNAVVKDLFSRILLHIHNHVTSGLPIPRCLDQPFIVYHAVKDNLYDNQKLINTVVNNPNADDPWRPKHAPSCYNGQTICHFPGGPGDADAKIRKMRHFMNDVMFNVQFPINRKSISKPSISFVASFHNECPLLNKTYIWENSNIEFLESGKMKAFGLGKYRFIDKHLVKCDFGNREHLLKFDKDYSNFISVRKGDFAVVAGNILQNSVHA